MNTTQLIEQLDKQVKGFAKKLAKEDIKTLGYEKGFTPLYDTWIELSKDYDEILVRAGKEKMSISLYKALKLIRMRIAKVRITVEKIRKTQTVIFYNPKRKVTGEEDINKLANPIRRGLEGMEDKLQGFEDSKDINELLTESVLSTQPKED